jgi:hypothetical protein
MTATAILKKIEAMERELAVLKAQVKRLDAQEPARTFADLYGILSVQPGFSEEEIDAALYRFDWEQKPKDC